MAAGKRDFKTALCLLVLFFVGLGSEASLDTEDNIILRQSRQSLECSAYNEVGTVCSSVLGTASIFTAGRNITEIDDGILGQFQLYQFIPNSRCKELALVISCLSLYSPCTGAWCTNVNRTELEMMIKETCPCTGAQEFLCAQVQSSLVFIVSILVNLHRTDQAPPHLQCTNVSTENIEVPTLPPPTTPPLPGVPCQPYNGGVCSDVLGSQDVRVINYTETEIQLETTLIQARQIGNLTSECEKSLLYVFCLGAYLPCAGNVWCTPNGAAGLVTMLNDSCTCPKPASTQCELSKAGIFAQAQHLARFGVLFDRKEKPSNRKCQVLIQDSAAFTTSQAYVYTVFTAALMIVVEMVV